MLRSYRHNYKRRGLRKEVPPRLYDVTTSPFFYQTTTIAPFVKQSLQGCNHMEKVSALRTFHMSPVTGTNFALGS